MNMWYIEERTGVYWPGLAPYRGREAATAGRGYGSEAEARARAARVAELYAARGGSGGPDLRVRHVAD